MSWLIPVNKLDEQQKEFIYNTDINRKNIWIKGFPGSGKSILLAYTVKVKIKQDYPSASICVVVFTHSLIAMFKAAFREMGLNVEVVTYFDFIKKGRSYDYVLVDEVQDLTPRILKELNRLGRHVIVCGDENQSIYETDPQFREATVRSSEITSLLSANTFSLDIIHRLTRNIIEIVNKFLPNMNIFAARRDATKGSTQVKICEAKNFNDEVKYIIEEGEKAVNVGSTVGILIPSAKDIIEFVNCALRLKGKPEWSITLNRWGRTDFDDMNRHLSRNNVPLQYVGNGTGEFSETSRKMCIMTYHSAKGLDFENVFLPFLSRRLFISRNEELSKTLFMVAMTRSRNNLYLTYNGMKHDYISNFTGDCHNIKIGEQKPMFGGGMFGGV